MPHVYILHFDRKVANHAGHYCGWTPNGTEQRLELHRKGQGSRLCEVAVERGIKLSLANEWAFNGWKEAREYERKLKREKHLDRHCPVCGGH